LLAVVSPPAVQSGPSPSRSSREASCSCIAGTGRPGFRRANREGLGEQRGPSAWNGRGGGSNQRQTLGSPRESRRREVGRETGRRWDERPWGVLLGTRRRRASGMPRSAEGNSHALSLALLPGALLMTAPFLAGRPRMPPGRPVPVRRCESQLGTFTPSGALPE
jgi:hypothetical protein